MPLERDTGCGHGMQYLSLKANKTNQRYQHKKSWLVTTLDIGKEKGGEGGETRDA